MILLLISLVLSLVYVLVACSLRHRLLRYLMVFYVSIYSAQLLLAIWDPYNVWPISLSTIVLFHLQIIFLLIGSYVYDNKNKHRLATKQEYSWPSFKVGWLPVILVTILVAYCFYNYKRMHSLILLMENTINARGLYFTEFFDSYTDIMIDGIITSFKYVVFFMSFVIIFSSTKRPKLKELYIVIAGLAAIALETITSMGRGVIMQYVFMLLPFALICKIYYPKVFHKRVLPLGLVVISVVVVVVVISTFIRANLKADTYSSDNAAALFLEPFVTYIYVPIQAFDYGVDHIFNYGFPFLGGATLSGFIDILLKPLILLDSSFENWTIMGALGDKMTPMFSFPSGKEWNALFTGGINYYLDFGFFGFMLFPFIHGYLFAKFSYNHTKSIMQFFLLAYLCYCSFWHLTSLTIENINVTFILLWGYFMVKEKFVYHKQKVI